MQTAEAEVKSRGEVDEIFEGLSSDRQPSDSCLPTV